LPSVIGIRIGDLVVILSEKLEKKRKARRQVRPLPETRPKHRLGRPERRKTRFGRRDAKEVHEEIATEETFHRPNPPFRALQ
jgi:hypothetical protein